MSQFLSAFQIHVISREEGGNSSLSQSELAAILGLIGRISHDHSGELIAPSEKHGVYVFKCVDQAVKAGIAIQKEMDALNAIHHTDPIKLASIGIVSLINPFTQLPENERSIELAQFLANSAGSGELYLSEGAFNSLQHPQNLSCRFARQLIRTGEDRALNAYEVFWSPIEIELGRLNRDPDEVDIDTQPIRSFGIKLFLFILFLFFSVLLMTIGYESVWEFFIKILYK